MIDPTWKRHAQDMHSDNDVVADKAQEAFVTERSKEMQISPKAREWEEGRRQEWIKNKPEYVKKRNKKILDPSLKTLENLRDAGSFQEEVIPSPGLVLIDVDPVETKTPSGYVLPETKDDTPNTGTVIEVGQALVATNGDRISFPFKRGDRVIFQKYAPNMHVNIKGHRFFFMQFNTILGKFKTTEEEKGINWEVRGMDGKVIRTI